MGRSPCCDKNGLKKGPWTTEEDQLLTDYIQLHGPGNWRNLPKNAGLKRCGKSCRLRWTNYLRPDIKRGRFSFEEEESIIQLHSIMGNKWSAIAARLPGRTDNEVKNYWNTHIRKRLLRMGVDPVTHSPRLDLLESLSSLMGSASSIGSYNNFNTQLNLSSLLGLQALLNPELLRLLSNIASPSISNESNNQILISQLLALQQNQSQNQNQNQNSLMEFQGGQFQPEISMQQQQVLGSSQAQFGVISNVSGQTTPENSSSPLRNIIAGVVDHPHHQMASTIDRLDSMDASLERLIRCSNNDQQGLSGFDSSGVSTPLSSPNMDPLSFDIPIGSLDLSAFL